MLATWLESGESLSAETLRAEGIHYERLTIGSHHERLAEVQKSGGYITQDEVQLRPDTPNLDTITAKFVDEHRHDEDEVRFVLEGEGIFDIRSRSDRWMRVVVHPGDLIVVPTGTWHRFFLTETKTMHCARLFQDKSGWTPHYRETGAAAE